MLHVIIKVTYGFRKKMPTTQTRLSNRKAFSRGKSKSQST